MVSLFRLKGRALQLGNVFLLTLTLATALMLFFAVGLLPLIFVKLQQIYIINLTAQAKNLLNFFLAAVCVFLTVSVRWLMNLGIKRYFFKRAQRQSCTSSDIFFYFRPRKMLSALFFKLRITAIRFLVFLFTCFPALITAIILLSSSQEGISFGVWLGILAVSVLFSLSGTVFYQAIAQSLFLCEYYYISGKYVTFRNLLASSQTAMRGKKRLLSGVKLSFSGWFIFCVTLLPISYVWSYYNQTLAVTAKEFMEKKLFTKEG